jgi:hypothetical protein
MDSSCAGTRIAGRSGMCKTFRSSAKQKLMDWVSSNVSGCCGISTEKAFYLAYNFIDCNK